MESFISLSSISSPSLYRGRCSGSLVALPRRLSPKVEASRFYSLRSRFCGRRLVIRGPKWKPLMNRHALTPVQMSLSFAKTTNWWEKGQQANMKEIESAQHLIDCLLNAGENLVIVDFFSPGCAGCRALHPKICQFAEMNSDVQFLQINYDKHKSMCYSLNVHVLPFFRFYRGAQGRLCSFSCTNATIKKFKDALAKHTPSRCSLGPTKGLDEKELLALAANKDLSFTYTPMQVHVCDDVAVNMPAKSTEITVSTIRQLAKESEDSTHIADEAIRR